MGAHAIAHGLMVRPLKNGAGWLVLCPVHGDKRPSLSIRDGADGKILIKCFAGCDSREILRTFKEMGFLDGEPSSGPAPASKPKDRSDLLDRIWSESHLIKQGSMVSRYLASRGITLPDWPTDLREHHSLAVYQDGRRTGQTFPALISIIRNGEGRPAGLHVTFIKEDGSGKAEIDSPRKIIGLKEGSTRGGCVRLMEPVNGTIGIGEGIESTLSASILTGVPGWSALTAGGIERASLPAEIRRVVLFADRDSAGLRAAANACERFRSEGRQSEILVPDGWKQDFNDLIKNAHPVGS
ncbi:MAG: DUF7146 domain-containing protein [Leptospirales bacterium]